MLPIKNDSLNPVEYNKLINELIRKEYKYQLTKKEYVVNPRRIFPVTGKVNSLHEYVPAIEDSNFQKLVENTYKCPKEKQTETLTEAQEYGWDLQRLIDNDPNDYRFDNKKSSTEISRLYKTSYKKEL